MINKIKVFGKTHKKVLLELTKISFPIVFEQLFINIMSSAVTVFLSRFSQDSLAPYSMVDSISQLFISLFTIIVTGVTIVVSYYKSINKLKMVRLYSAQSIFMGLSFAIVCFLTFYIYKRQMLTLIFGPIDPDVLNEALVYFDLTSFSLIAFSIFQVIFSILRACDNIHTTIFITLGMNILNIILSIIYIYGIDYYFLDMHLYIKSYGLVGAGIAVLVSRCLGALVTVYYLLYKVKLFKLTEIRLFIPLIRSQKYILSNGWPTGSEMTLYNIGKLITQIFVVSLGPIAISANSVGSSVFNIINVIGNAFAIAAMVLTGRMVSYKNHINIKSTVYISIAFGSLLIFIFCAPIYFNTEAISNLYGVGHQVKPYINNILKLLCITVSLFWGAAFITPACLRTFGYIKYTAVIAVISMWLFRVVLGYVLAILLNMGIMGIWIGLYIDWIFRSACFIIKFKRSSVY